MNPRSAVLSVGIIALAMFGCSTVETQRTERSLASIQSNERLRLLVMTGDATMDRLVYELAFREFGSRLPLREKEPFTGTMEITFTSSTQGYSMGSTTSVGSATATGSGWYTGTGYVGGTATVSGVSTSTSYSQDVTWQNSTMFIVVKTEEGERLWTADYGYKGAWEMSGLVVNTPQEAARLVVKRLKEKFEKDFKQKG